MKVKVSLPSDGEADLSTAQTGVEDGFEVDFDALEIKPYFWSDRAAPNVLFIEAVTDDGQVTQRLMVRLRGSDGKLQVIDRSKRVKPACEAVPTEASIAAANAKKAGGKAK